MRESGLYRSAPVSLFAGSSLSLIVTALFLFMAASCNDESSPFSSPEGDVDCIYYEDYLHIAGFCDTPGSAWGVAVSGECVYIAETVDVGLIH